MQGQEGMDAGQGSYPERPGEPDCVYYMRTGLCGFGMTCRFNHPPNRKLVGFFARRAQGYGGRDGADLISGAGRTVDENVAANSRRTELMICGGCAGSGGGAGQGRVSRKAGSARMPGTTAAPLTRAQELVGCGLSLLIE